MSTTLNQVSVKGVSKPSSARQTTSSGFIIGPVADSLLIIGAPLLALAIAAPLFSLPAVGFQVSIRAVSFDLRQILITTFINAHLFLVFIRSHANPNIFKIYPWRFIAVPLALLILGGINRTALGVMGVVVVWWDVYHSSLQTFGFGRIYDSKQKNDAVAGRELDYWLNLLMYLGPVLAGAHFIDHINNSTDTLQILVSESSNLDELFLQHTPDYLQRHQFYLAAAVLTFGAIFIPFYVYSYYRLQQKGYHISWQKVWLMIITSAVSVYCWGFRSFIDAFWVMNFFHALQYFAIVIFAEHRNLAQVFRLDRYPYGWILASFWVTSFCLVYGVWSGYYASGDWSLSLITTTALMHFWYDGFIWSVKKKQV